jgi:uncharacterized protein (TIGR00296 family)
MTLTLEDGTMAVRIARETLDAHVTGKRVERKPRAEGVFSELRGVFVTINLASPTAEKLRGCIGFPYPIKPLGQAIQEAAIAASSEDPRFPPVSAAELNSVVLEVSILTQPKVISTPRTQDLPSKVRIGVDGLIVSRHGFSGLLLPQVATEYSMDQTEFLSQACMKAGLLPDSWLDRDTEVQAFQAEVFAEITPRGEVVRTSTSER